MVSFVVFACSLLTEDRHWISSAGCRTYIMYEASFVKHEYEIYSVVPDFWARDSSDLVRQVNTDWFPC
jgi:hypothetical protein